MKAWHVTCKYDTLLADLVLAETAGKAKIKSWMYTDEGIDFIDLRTKREPKLDNKEKITPLDAYNAGYMTPCYICGKYVMKNWNDDEIIIDNNNVYHKQCHVA